MASMQALSDVTQKASANDFAGSAVLNLLQSQVIIFLVLVNKYYFWGCFHLSLLLYHSQIFDAFFPCPNVVFCNAQAKAMAGDNAVRSLLEKMTHYASNAYLSILERYA